MFNWTETTDEIWDNFKRETGNKLSSLDPFCLTLPRVQELYDEVLNSNQPLEENKKQYIRGRLSLYFTKLQMIMLETALEYILIKKAGGHTDNKKDKVIQSQNYRISRQLIKLIGTVKTLVKRHSSEKKLELERRIINLNAVKGLQIPHWSSGTNP